MFSSFSFHLTDSFLKLLRSAPFLHPLQREVLYNSNMGLSHSTFHWKILDLLNDFFKFVYIKINSLSYKVLQLLTNASLSCIQYKCIQMYLVQMYPVQIWIQMYPNVSSIMYPNAYIIMYPFQ